MGKFILPIVVGAIGVAFVCISIIVGWVIVPDVIEDKVKEEVRLINNTDTWSKWVKNPVPIYLQFYIFHVTNAQEVNENGQQPILKEFGPYTYLEERVKQNIIIDQVADTVTYVQPIKYTFQRDMSLGSDNDVYNIVNGAFVIVSNILYTKGSQATPLFPFLINSGERLVSLRVSVKQMLFDGYNIPKIYSDIFARTGEPTPEEFSDDKFGFYRHKNGSHDGVYVIKAGVKDHKDFGRILRWNNKERLEWWYPPTWLNPVKPNRTYCNMINGTDGTIFPPFVKKETILYNFITDICRSTFLVYKEDIEFRDIPGYKFGFSNEFYEDPIINGDNYCFCPTPGTEALPLESTCSAGVIRIFPCKHQGPIVTSNPHFLNANPKFRDLVSGLAAVENAHETYVQLEPNSGLMLKISKKVQINLEMQTLAPFDYFNSTRNYLFPVFWADENVELNEHYADELKSKLVTPMKIAEISKWTILGVGSLLIVVTTVLLVLRVRQ